MRNCRFWEQPTNRFPDVETWRGDLLDRLARTACERERVALVEEWQAMLREEQRIAQAFEQPAQPQTPPANEVSHPASDTTEQPNAEQCCRRCYDPLPCKCDRVKRR